MDEQEIINKLKGEGYDPVWVYEAPPGEIDEEHSHEYDTKLVILNGTIVVGSAEYREGGEVLIPRNTPHSAKVGPDGCRYVVAERHQAGGEYTLE